MSSPHRSDPVQADALALHATHDLHLVARGLTAMLDREFARFDLTSQQAGLLLRAAQDQKSPSQLALLLGTDTAGVTRLLDRLETKGLVQRGRHSSDRRSVVITLTALGRSLLPELPAIFGQVCSRLFAGLTKADTDRLGALLQLMVDNLHFEADAE